MKGTIVALMADGKVAATRANGEPDLEILQWIVGGSIEQVPHLTRCIYAGKVRNCVAFCNAEGKINGLPVNARATRLLHAGQRRAGMPPHDRLAGDVAIVFGDAAFMRAL
jgi:hypothetical protein